MSVGNATQSCVTTPLFPSLYSGMCHWELEIDRGGRITPEKSGNAINQGLIFKNFINRFNNGGSCRV